MNEEEIGQEILACCRYGELEPLKEFLEELNKEYSSEVVKNYINFVDMQGSNGI